MRSVPILNVTRPLGGGTGVGNEGVRGTVGDLCSYPSFGPFVSGYHVVPTSLVTWTTSLRRTLNYAEK